MWEHSLTSIRYVGWQVGGTSLEHARRRRDSLDIYESPRGKLLCWEETRWLFPPGGRGST